MLLNIKQIATIGGIDFFLGWEGCRKSLGREALNGDKH